ncbi:MAG: bifunctional phosphopantothenoylcysteine decarboxylase/phosphopantothenate--cysteine ligase CoaBC [Deltaproteobacteria bacterium]|nr:bifunctional phosphopantothenoylcysteine decarboxylase/phosphopantothenate--cysteine ligase CoaBC [Deltaproteobacteria bacterium]MBW2137125.1 bifunctional phosphopantothenoylcysteine decarboxylase/phosphopantothenate--cysteine ligase CoaBC [Deltaproteobacteria bacterium]
MKDKNIIVGVTGGIAAYKSVELVRLILRAGAFSVKVAMTRNAARFVSPLTFRAVSGNRVIGDMWDPATEPMDHIDWAQGSDLIIIAPATANFIGKMAHGLADDFLSTLVLASTAKILVCPSMNTKMLENPSVQANLDTLRERGFTVMDPDEGELACRTEGPGRLPDPEKIVEEARTVLSEKDLSGLNVLVTAGATMEPIDPVRYITNRSSGKMGYALARVARRRGATVTLVSGPGAITPPDDVDFVRVMTSEEMREVVLEKAGRADVVIKAAAVLDYKPRKKEEYKIKKEKGSLRLELVRTPDILAELGDKKGEHGYLLVGFAAETQELVENAKDKLERKNLDMIVANDVSRSDAGFETDTNRVKILHREGHIEDLPLMTKEEVAEQVLDRIRGLWGERS